MTCLEHINGATHPGEFIREELEERGWSQRDLSSILGVEEELVARMINGEVVISADMAFTLANAFNVSADFFNNLQRSYDKSRNPTMIIPDAMLDAAPKVVP